MNARRLTKKLMKTVSQLIVQKLRTMRGLISHHFFQYFFQRNIEDHIWKFGILVMNHDTTIKRIAQRCTSNYSSSRKSISMQFHTSCSFPFLNAIDIPVKGQSKTKTCVRKGVHFCVTCQPSYLHQLCSNVSHFYKDVPFCFIKLEFQLKFK